MQIEKITKIKKQVVESNKKLHRKQELQYDLAIFGTIAIIIIFLVVIAL